MWESVHWNKMLRIKTETEKVFSWQACVEFFKVFCFQSLKARGKNELRYLSSNWFETVRKKVKMVLFFFKKIIGVCWVKVSCFAECIGLSFWNVLSLRMFSFPIYIVWGFFSPVFPCQPGSPQQKPKRLRLVVDVSGSMYRFNGVDGRLERSMEAVCMVMEAFENYEHKFKVITAGLGALWLLHRPCAAVEKVFQQSVQPKNVIHSHKEI